MSSPRLLHAVPALLLLLAPATPRADVVTDWNAKGEAIGLEKRPTAS